MRTQDVRMMVVDDSVEMLDSVIALCSLLPDVRVVARASSALEALDVVRSVEVDVVLMDICMPGMDGFEATRRLLAGPRPPRILLFSTHEADAYAEAAQAAGAHGFLRKLDLRSELLPMVRLCGLVSRRSL